MAVINYSDQFKYSGKGYIDSKVAPVETLDELNNMSAFLLGKYYQPGMVVLVMDDGLGHGPSDYVLDEEYKWRKLVDDSILEARVDEVEARIDEAEKTVESLDERVKSIASQVDTNKKDIVSLSERLAQIAGIDKIKEGENIKITNDEDGNMVISAIVPEVDLTLTNFRLDMLESGMSENAERIDDLESGMTESNKRLGDAEKDIDILEERIDSLSGGEGDVVVDDSTIEKDEDKKLSVKISDKEDNAIIVDEDGLYSQGIFIEGDDVDNEIL